MAAWACLSGILMPHPFAQKPRRRARCLRCRVLPRTCLAAAHAPVAVHHRAVNAGAAPKAWALARPRGRAGAGRSCPHSCRGRLPAPGPPPAAPCRRRLARAHSRQVAQGPRRTILARPGSHLFSTCGRHAARPRAFPLRAFPIRHGVPLLVGHTGPRFRGS